MKYWVISHGRDGFALHVEERSAVGHALAWLIENADMDWWGRYKNIPFCWINPWGWTWHVGPEGHTLGDGWLTFGHKLMHWAWKLERQRNLITLPLTDEQVREKFPDTWTWHVDTMDLERTEEAEDEGAVPGPAEPAA